MNVFECGDATFVFQPFKSFFQNAVIVTYHKLKMDFTNIFIYWSEKEVVKIDRRWSEMGELIIQL